MKKVFHFFLPLLVFSLNLFSQPVWGQLQTLYTHREINFFEEEEKELEGYDEALNRLIPYTDIFINFNTGVGFIAEKNNFEQIKSIVNQIKDNTNKTITQSSNQFGYFRENKVNPYQVGISIDAFIFKYFGIGFTYSRNHYFSHLFSISPPKSEANTNYYNQTIGYNVGAVGNNFQFSVMGRYPLGKRFNYNIYIVGGVGYSLSTLILTLQSNNKVSKESSKQKYRSTSHAFHFFTEMMFKVKHFSFGFGLLFQTITFSKFISPDKPKFIPKKYEGIKLGPTLYFKIGVNF